MNKPNLIQSLKDSNHLSESEAEAVINLFSIKWPTHWHKAIELKSEAFVHFS